jgi:hypothetical protein
MVTKMQFGKLSLAGAAKLNPGGRATCRADVFDGIERFFKTIRGRSTIG